MNPRETYKKEKLTAPYNFVPLNKEVYCPDWSNQVSMDIPFSDGEDGIIEVEIENLSPLFTRNGVAQDSKLSEYSSHIVGKNGEKHYFIPGTTLKGMLQNVMKILSFGKMDRVNDDYFGYRNFDTKTSNNDYTNRMASVEAGWLKKKGDDYYLVPCPSEYEKITHKELQNIVRTFDRKASIPEKEDTFKDQSYNVRNGYKLVFTGWIHNKKHEYLFPILIDEEYSFTHESIKLSKKVKDAFLTVHKPTPLWDEHFYPTLKKEKAIPVFFTRKGDEIHSVGLSRMYRLPYKSRVSDAITQAMDGENDLCEIIWGYIDGKNSLRGRVQVGHAFATNSVADTRLKEVAGVLGTPKASYYPLYLKPEQKGRYATYDSSGVEISGWKRYRTHGSGEVALPQGNGNEKTTSRFLALPANLKFTLKIAVHNLRPIEVGALLSALTLHNCSNVWHNLGLAKGYGYGKISCKIIQLTNFRKAEEDYLRLFEEAMTLFVNEKGVGESWSKMPQIQQFVNIASKHDSVDLVTMKLEDKAFEYYKKNTNFCVLQEADVAINSYYSSEDILAAIEQSKLSKLMNDLEVAKQREDGIEVIRISDYIINNFSSADAVALKQLKSIYRKKQYANDFNELILADEKKEYNRVIEICKLLENRLFDVDIPEIVDLRIKTEGLKALEKQALGLSILEEKTSQGNYKVKDFHKQVKKEVDKYLKRNELHQVPHDQIPILAATLKRIYSTLIKERDKANWQVIDRGVWKEVETWVGKEVVEQLFKEIIQ